MIGSTNSIWEVNNKQAQLVNYTMIYDAGDECIDVTGGLSSNGYVRGGTGTYVLRDATKNSDNFYVYYKSGGNIYMLGTQKTIDITNYTRFGVVYKVPGSHPTYGVRARLRTVKSLSEGGVTSAPTQGTRGVKCIGLKDITEYTGNVYVEFSSDEGASYNGYFYNVFFTGADNWQMLAEKAGITASSIDEILTNSTTLLSNEKAVEFMIYNCTGDFMVSAVANSTFLTALNNSQYKTIIWANEHWAKFLNMIA